jgi:hypothetical protein
VFYSQAARAGYLGRLRAAEKESGMRIVVAHRSTENAAIQKLDQASDKLLAMEIKNIQIVDQKKAWNGPVLSFSFTGKMGFISLPLSGTATVDETNVTLEFELPSLLKNLLGEEKVRATVEQNIRALVS